MNSEDSQAVTKGDLLALESRMQERMEALETCMLDRLEALETRMSERMEALEIRMLERMEALETRLLTAFQQWAVPINGRLRKLDAGDGVLNERRP